MRTETIEFKYNIYNSIDELSKDEQELVKKAILSVDNSYAPYSQFHVGAAALLENGETVQGNNIENTVSPVCICAERTALFSSAAQYPNTKILKLAITAKADNFELEEPASPCGSCRQVLVEFETKQQHPIKVILYNKNHIISVESARYLLPLTFDETRLKKH